MTKIILGIFLTMTLTSVLAEGRPCTFMFEGSSSQTDYCMHIEASGFETAELGKQKNGGKLRFYFWESGQENYLNMANAGHKLYVSVYMPAMFGGAICGGNGKLNSPTWTKLETAGYVLDGTTLIEPGLYLVTVRLGRNGASYDESEEVVRKIPVSKNDPVYNQPDEFIFKEINNRGHIFLIQPIGLWGKLKLILVETFWSKRN